MIILQQNLWFKIKLLNFHRSCYPCSNDRIGVRSYDLQHQHSTKIPASNKTTKKWLSVEGKFKSLRWQHHLERRYYFLQDSLIQRQMVCMVCSEWIWFRASMTWDRRSILNHKTAAFQWRPISMVYDLYLYFLTISNQASE